MAFWQRGGKGNARKPQASAFTAEQIDKVSAGVIKIPRGSVGLDCSHAVSGTKVHMGASIPRRTIRG